METLDMQEMRGVIKRFKEAMRLEPHLVARPLASNLPVQELEAPMVELWRPPAHPREYQVSMEAVMTRVGENLAAFITATVKKRKPKVPKTRRRY